MYISMAKQGKFLLFLCTFPIFLYGCDSKPLSLWIASENVQMLKTHHNDNLDKYKQIMLGEVCVPGESVVEKVYEYTEVLCENAGYGWTIDPQKFSKKHQ